MEERIKIMARKNHKNTRRIVVSNRVIEAARMVTLRHPDEYEAYAATRVVASRRISRRMWKQLTNLA